MDVGHGGTVAAAAPFRGRERRLRSPYWTVGAGWASRVTRRPLDELVHPSWAAALAPAAATLTSLGDFLRTELASGRGYLPPGDAVLRAFRAPLGDVRVLVVGQDPYPTPGHAVGLSFSVAPGTKPLPRSLQNIFREYVNDLGLPAPATGDLTPWRAAARRAPAQPRPDRGTGPTRLPPGARLGGRHRPRDRRAGRARRAAGRRPVGARPASARPDSPPSAASRSWPARTRARCPQTAASSAPARSAASTRCSPSRAPRPWTGACPDPGGARRPHRAGRDVQGGATGTFGTIPAGVGAGSSWVTPRCACAREPLTGYQRHGTQDAGPARQLDRDHAWPWSCSSLAHC